jgi:hypothetical protein
VSGLDALQEVVSPAILRRAGEISRLLRELEIPHVLIGGLAVGLHGYPRATADVDFLVGQAAFASTSPIQVFREELRDLARVGETDIMSVPGKYPGLVDELRLEDDVPVISLRGLVLLKLDANRARDRDDVRALLEHSPEQVRPVRDYLLAQAPELISRLAEILARR